MKNKIPVSVIVTTKNEEKNIERCLAALADFSELVVVDSHSQDRTCAIAAQFGAQVVSFRWDGKYPKKRQWCLDTLALKYDWVFWVDADEVVTPELVEEIRHVFASPVQDAGFFVRGQYVWRGKLLRHGMMNNKIVLFDRRKMEFPLVDDTDIEGMGEMEGHYQPVLKDGKSGAIGQVKSAMVHFAAEDMNAWEARHQRYAKWEAGMIRKNAWVMDPIIWRESLKVAIRTSFLRPFIMFFYSYVWCFGFLDGQEGFDFALSRYRYCRMILNELPR